MMQIIEHGNTYNTAKCNNCNCVFSYTGKDIMAMYENGNTSNERWVFCPECGRAVVVEGKEKENVNKIK
jgi:hypothetical protein